MDAYNRGLIQKENSFDSSSFDLDLISDPFHKKLFSHLNQPVFDDLAPISEVSRRSFKEWEAGLLFVAIIVSVWVYAWLLESKMALNPKLPPKSISIDLVPFNSKKTLPNIQPDSDFVQTTVEQPRFIQEKTEEAFVENDTLDEILNEDKATNKNYNFRSQVETVVKKYHENQISPIVVPKTGGLKAPALVFDSSLRDQLNSPEIEKLNLWRAPTDDQLALELPAVSSGAGAELGVSSSSFYKIGDSCYSMSFNDIASNTPSVPIMGNGWNLSNYRKIDCNWLYLNESIKRSDINSTQTNTR